MKYFRECEFISWASQILILFIVLLFCYIFLSGCDMRSIRIGFAMDFNCFYLNFIAYIRWIVVLWWIEKNNNNDFEFRFFKLVNFHWILAISLSIYIESVTFSIVIIFINSTLKLGHYITTVIFVFIISFLPFAIPASLFFSSSFIILSCISFL
jgi:hypothetical protein